MPASYRIPVTLTAILCLVLPAAGQTYKSQIEHPIVRYKMAAGSTRHRIAVSVTGILYEAAMHRS